MHGRLLSLESLLSWEAFSKIASAFSIASFGLTLWVLLETRKLRALYKLRVRGPLLIKDLHKMTSTLSSYLNDYSNSIAQIDQELGKIGVKLKSLEVKLGGAPKRSVKLVRSYIDQYDVNIENEAQVRRTYVEIIKVIEELKDHQKDLDWEF
jgi:hypothetical protein